MDGSQNRYYARFSYKVLLNQFYSAVLCGGSLKGVPVMEVGTYMVWGKIKNRQHLTPLALLRLQLVVIAASFLTILIFSGVGIYHLYSDYIVKRTEADAVSISQSFVAMNHDVLLPLLGSSAQVAIESRKLQALDAALRIFLSPFQVIKIKIFSPDRVIVYSTEASLIGQASSENIHLDKALSGKNSSTMQTKKEMTDLAFESRFDVNVVETYVPIYDLRGEIVGGFEIYQDMTRYRSDFIQGVSLAVAVLLLILLIVFFMLFKLLQYPTKQLLRAQKELQFLASIDSLTFLYNRHEIIKRLKAEAARAFRGEGTLSIILLDLDNFKKINDSYGHPAGDAVLREVAKNIQRNVREYNAVGRYGGEEFLVVLPDSDRRNAAKVAERIRQSIESAVIEYDKKILTIEISAGVSTLIPSEINVEALIKRADDALYLAKSNGRNQVMTDLSIASMQNH